MYIPRQLAEKIKKASQYFKVILLIGARQVGKNTILKQLFPGIPHLVFDAHRDLYQIKEDPDLFLNNHSSPMILDEIQYVPELLSSLKRKVDEVESMGQYFLTGSQNFSMMRGAAESMAGRVLIINLRILTPFELVNCHTSWLQQLIETPDQLTQKINQRLATGKTLFEHLWFGGFPKCQTLDRSLISDYFNSYVQTYLERDVRLLENINDLNQFDRFLGILAALSAQEINYSQLGREIGLSPVTSQKWLNVMKYSYLWEEIPAFSNNAIKRISKRAKGYFADTGLLCYLQHIASPESLRSHPLLGALFETFCVNLTMTLSQRLAINPKFYHWRANSGAEVDLIMEYEQVYYPIEIKCKTVVTRRDASGIKAFKDSNPGLNIGTAIILFAGNFCYSLEKDIIAVPWDSFAENK